ncbi:PREDICTED: reticulon-1-like, partial [Fulmarus glacialis]|uniref:reticulon-1-like n=1 Tax=Fulmarus glacialis TaxID=30455 RepID=UPI00051C025F
ADGADQYAAGAPLRDGDGAQQREQLVFGSAREHPPVAMATASPGVTASSHLFDYSSTANGGDSSFYTSLISDVHYTTPRDSTYFTGMYKQENTPIPCSGSTEGFNTLGHPVQDVTGFESRGLFSSDSGIEMTPAESTEVDKTLADPMKVEAYKYMDISRSEEIKYQEKHDPDSEDESPGHIDKSSEGAKAAKEQDLLEDTRSGDQHGASVITAPVKITLTEIESAGEAASKESSPTQPETGLKPSHEVVPTVTVSEPEDDSPGSVTPPSSGT